MSKTKEALSPKLVGRANASRVSLPGRSYASGQPRKALYEGWKKKHPEGISEAREAAHTRFDEIGQGAPIRKGIFTKKASMDKEAVSNIGEEEMNFIKHVRLTREDTRRDANALFTKAPQARARDIKLMEKLFVQAPGAIVMTHNLLKEASAEQWEAFEKVKVAYNVHAYFESGAHLTPAQRRFPELTKVGKARPVVSMKKVPAVSAPVGDTAGSTSLPGSHV